MPPVKLEKVISVSSEDPVHVAANLLKGDFNGKKWKSRAPGEKQISVVLQMERPSKISSIDIGNENSAFVEILVAKLSSGTEDFKVLLAATSLMTLKEAKFSTNTNAVKFVKTGDLCEDTRNDKWDRIKIVCTQHYNTVSQFGLSFIAFHTEEDDPQSAPAQPDLGKFHLKPPDPKGPVTALVSAWAKKKEQTSEHRGAAAVNAAVRGGDIKLPSAKNAPVSAKVTALPPTDAAVLDTNVDLSSAVPSTAVAKPKPRKPKRDVAPHEAPKRKHLLSPSTSKDSPKKKPKVAAVSSMQAASRPRRPFNRLMENVVFVISGFQNPLRSDIRNSALAMGAKYKADWDRSCTHLICAFPNTPKFNQVRGLGKIVKKDWVEQCYESRKRLPWRRFALDTQDLTQPESEEEIWEIVDPPMDNRRRLNDSSSEDDEIEKEVKRIQHIQKASPANVTVPTNASPGPQSRLSEDDEPPKLNIYEVETEDETDGAADVLENLPKMPSFFESFNFLILDDIEESERAKLTRYIAARLGNVVTDVQELSPSSPTYCITEDDSRLKEVKEAFPDIKGTRPDWIWFCHDENCFKDAAPFSI